MKDWSYALLSKAAKAAGGPDEFVNSIVEASKQEGEDDTVKTLTTVLATSFGAGVVAILGSEGVKKLIKYFSDKRKKSTESLENAKQELIQDIKEYDLEQKQDNV